MSIPAFASIDGTDHAGYLWVFTICGIIYAAAATVSRWVIKSGLHGIDDILLFLGTVSAASRVSEHVYKSENV